MMNRLVSLLRLASLMLCAALLSPSANAATWYVATNGSDSNLGTTAAKPFKTIQQGVSHAAPGDTVSVADGTYSGTKNYNIDFGGVDMTVQSASGNPAKCIVDCQQLGNAFYLHNSETTKSNIAGFTIKNGKTGSGGGIYISSNNPTVVNCVFTGNTAFSSGGGLFGGAASDCAFIGNSAAGNGGGMVGGTASFCTFTSNTANFGGGMNGGTASHCTFTRNISSDFGGGMEGGMATYCTFTGNTAASQGGGAINTTAMNCIFIGNSANTGGGMYLGSGVMTMNCLFCFNAASSGGGLYGGYATNCLIFGNSASGSGGGVFSPGAPASLYFCTVVNNTAQVSGGGIDFANGPGSVTNCIVWGNTASTSGLGIYGTGTVTYSDIQQGSTGTNGNINADPKFVNQSSGNLHLTAASTACINKGTLTVPSGFTFPTTDCDGGKRTIGSLPDMGAYEFGNVGIYGTLTFDGISTLAPAQNVTFQFRPASGGAAINTTYFTTSDGAFYLYGVPNGKYNLWVKSPTYLAALVPVTVAGGAASITATLPAGDANNDNSVDSSDFGVLIGAFNTSASVPGSGYDPTADFNGDGVIDSSDFGLLIGNYNTVGAP